MKNTKDDLRMSTPRGKYMASPCRLPFYPLWRCHQAWRFFGGHLPEMDFGLPQKNYTFIQII